MDTRRQSSWRRVVRVSNVVVPTTLATVGSAVFLVPSSGVRSAPLVFALHYTGMALLAAFLVFAVACHLTAWRCSQRVLKVRAYRRWWTATMLLPPTAACTILFTGMRLVFDGPANDVVRLPWLFWLVLLFAFFFFDGLLFYLPEVASRFQSWARGDGRDTGHGSDTMLVLHALSFPLVLGIGLFRPPSLQVPDEIAQVLAGVCADCDPALARLSRAATLVGAVGVLVLGLRVRGLMRQIRQLTAPG